VLRVRRTVNVGGQVAHLLQLLLQSVQGPNVNGVVNTIQDLDGYRGLSGRGEYWICDVSKLSKSSNRLKR